MLGHANSNHMCVYLYVYVYIYAYTQTDIYTQQRCIIQYRYILISFSYNKKINNTNESISLFFLKEQ